jgi:hypothetical protein
MPSFSASLFPVLPFFLLPFFLLTFLPYTFSLLYIYSPSPSPFLCFVVISPIFNLILHTCLSIWLIFLILPSQCEQQDKKRTKEERDLVARLRIFARFHSVTDHEVCVCVYVCVCLCVYMCVCVCMCMCMCAEVETFLFASILHFYSAHFSVSPLLALPLLSLMSTSVIFSDLL